jgi:hypothetical protein
MEKERVNWITHKGKQILYIDYTGLKTPKDTDIILKTIEAAKKIVENSQENLLFLSNATDASTNIEVMNELKQFAAYCKQKDIVKKECIIGIAGLKKVLLNAVNTFAKSSLKTFETLEEAKDWLISEESG